MLRKGIDVSFAQGGINWDKVNVDFAIIRAGYGRYTSQRDDRFENNYAGCMASGIPVGTYWYSYALSEKDAVKEARACLEVIKGKAFEYPVYLDIEEKNQFALGKEKCSAIAKAFLDTVEKAGYWVGLYSNKNNLQNGITAEIRKRYAVWVAQYNSEVTYGGAYGMWQYTNDGRVGGIGGSVDLDYCYVDYPKLIREKGLNGLKKPEPLKVLDTTGVRRGDGKTKGDKALAVLNLKALLILAKNKGIQNYGIARDSVFGDGTENAVNFLLKKWGYAQNGIAGENFTLRLLSELVSKK